MSFVLKSGNGVLAGYLMQRQGEICLRAQGLPSSGGKLVLIGRDGREREHSVAPTEGEMRWPDEGMTVSAAYILEGTKLLLQTGEDAREACLRRMEAEERKKPRAEMNARERDMDQRRPPVPERERPPASEKKTHEPIPERRWPPPPCCPGARYKNGQWRIS